MIHSEVLPASVKNASSEKTIPRSDNPKISRFEDASLIFTPPENDIADVGEAVV